MSFYTKCPSQTYLSVTTFFYEKVKFYVDSIARTLIRWDMSPSERKAIAL